MNRRVIDLSGQRFGRLTVIKFAGIKRRQSTWLCQCDCGNKVIVIAPSLKNGGTQSCGCLHKEMMSALKYIDLMGMKFGRLTVVKDIGRKHGEVLWLCRCECGNEVEVQAGNLKKGHTNSCGCYKKQRTSESHYINLAGQKFGRLLVLEDAGRSNRGQSLWICRCDCGNITTKDGASLRNKNTQSCGCLNKELSSQRKYVDLTGKKFGMLTVIKDIGRIWGGINWRCECDCGNIIDVYSGNLTSGNTKSCGCLSESWMASELKKYYKKKYNAEEEYKILRNSDAGHWLYFDIFIPDYDIFIEVHGLQHYKFIPFWHKTEEQFKYNQKLDRMKRKFACKHGIYIEIDIRKVKTTKQAIEIIESYL